MKDIPGYEGLYSINENGVILSTYYKRKKPLKQAITNGYAFVSLWKNGTHKQQYVHRLLALTYLPNDGNKEQINHKNGIKNDNRISNIEWCTRCENAQHSFYVIKKTIPPTRKPVLDLRTGIYYDTAVDALTARGLRIDWRLMKGGKYDLIYV